MHPDFQYHKWDPKKAEFCRTEDLPVIVRDLIHVLEGAQRSIRLESSGSTGKPKLIEFGKREIRASVEMSHNFFDYQPKQKVLICLPVDKAGGLMAFARAILKGQHVYHCKPTTKSIQAALGSGHQFYMSSMVPLQLEKLKVLHLGELLANIKVLLIGGARVSETLEQWLTVMNINAFFSFGMTETLSHFAIRKLGESLYRALKGVDVSVDDNHLLVRSSVTGNRKILTDDIVELLGEQTFLWKGRASNVILSGGLKFYPEELEKQIRLAIKSGKLSSLEERDFILKAEPDAILAQRMVMIIEGRPFDTAELLSSLSLLMPKYANPKKVSFVRAFERTETGKILRA